MLYLAHTCKSPARAANTPGVWSNLGRRFDVTSIAQARCSKCGEIKPVSEFHKGRNPGGVQSYCKVCKRKLEAQRPHRSDKPFLREKTGPHEAPRFDLAGQTFRMWTVREWDAAAGRWVVECECGRQKRVRRGDWLNRHGVRTCVCTPRVQYNLLPPGEAACNELYNTYRAKARKRGFAFDLSPEQFRLLTTMNCAYCGAAPSQVNWTRAQHSGSRYIYNGIDRIDSQQGYTWANCTPCCGRCNTAKSDMTLEEWKAHILRIVSHLRLGGAQ